MTNNKILIATHNQSKIREFLDFFKNFPMNIISLNDLPDKYEEPVEDGNTYFDNALIKAKYYSERTGLPCIADDSGLEVALLNNAPGVYSARYAGENATISENNQKLIHELRKIGYSSSPARYVCVLVFYDSLNDKILLSQGDCYGSIKKNGKGRNGFGYDPYFSVYLDGINDFKTMGELSFEEKQKISHRRKAADSMKEQLIAYYKEGVVCE